MKNINSHIKVVIVTCAMLVTIAVGRVQAVTISPEDFAGAATFQWQQLSWVVNATPGTHFDIVCHTNYEIHDPIAFDNGGALDITLHGHNNTISLATGATLVFGNSSVQSVVNMKYVTFVDIGGTLDANPLVLMAWLRDSTFKKVHFGAGGNRGKGLTICRGNGLTFRTANFTGMQNIGMQIGEKNWGISDYNNMWACSWHNNQTMGAFFSSLRNSVIYGCSAEWNEGVGIGIHSSSSSDYSYGVSIQSCYILNNCNADNTRYAIEIGIPQYTQGDYNTWIAQGGISIYNNMIDGEWQKGGVAVYGRDAFSLNNNSIGKTSSSNYHLEAWGNYSTFEVLNNRDNQTGLFYYLKH